MTSWASPPICTARFGAPAWRGPQARRRRRRVGLALLAGPGQAGRQLAVGYLDVAGAAVYVQLTAAHITNLHHDGLTVGHVMRLVIVRLGARLAAAGRHRRPGQRGTGQ